jgi:hypothetical protein
MSKNEKMVTLKEAMEQVHTVGVRLALMHLAFSRILVESLGEERGKEAVVKAMMEYGRMVGERSKSGLQDLPWYGFHDKYVYEDQETVDLRQSRRNEDFDWSKYKVCGCVLAKVFKEYDESELGTLYCYVDAAKSMAADSSKKLTHTACEVCGDDFCAFDMLPTSEEERRAFKKQEIKWKDVDPILVKGAKLKD